MTPQQLRIQRLHTAIAECERFIARANWCLKETKRMGDLFYLPSAAHAATKRASMDVTRAMADVRRSLYDTEVQP